MDYDETIPPRVGSDAGIRNPNLKGFGRYFLEIANIPAICAGSHENHVLAGRILRIDQLVAIECLDFQFNLIAKLHGSTVGRIKDGFQMVAMIHYPNMHARMILLRDSSRQPIFGKSNELVAKSTALPDSKATAISRHANA